DAVPDPDVLALRFDVDVGRTLLDGARDDAVDRLDDRRIRGLDLFFFVLFFALGGLFEEVLGGAVETVEARDERLDLLRTSHQDLEPPAGRRAQVVHRDDVRRIGDGDDQRLVVETERNRLVTADERRRDELPRRRV